MKPTGHPRLGVERHVLLNRPKIRQSEGNHLGPLPILLEPATTVTVHQQIDNEQARDGSGLNREITHESTDPPSRTWLQ